MSIALAFSVVTALGMGMLGMSLFDLFEDRAAEEREEATEQLLSQSTINLENYLRNMRLISDAMYYSVIKEADMAEEPFDSQMNVLYEANKDNLISIACFHRNGRKVASVPFATMKENEDVTEQRWFKEAMEERENFHFSTPHVENIFDNTTFRYYWVISLSRGVELTENGHTAQGVLLIDMNYSSVERLLEKVNNDMTVGYVYLCDSNGEIIYHPRRNLINAGLYKENNLAAADYVDGTVEETFADENRSVTVKTVGYTGWKLVAVTPGNAAGVGLHETRYLVIIIVGIIILAMLFINSLISSRVTSPLDKLTRSVKVLDNGNLDPNIYVGGSTEVVYLGQTLRDAAEKMRSLLDDFVAEEKSKRRTELDALQSQINPHFLYNTLDSIVWMIEAGNDKDAVFMIKELASLFRISLSRGKSIISIEDEFKHARNYMNIQKVRYKNKFEVEFNLSPEIEKASTVKLIIQPLLENAIEYGVANGEDGEIEINGYMKDGDVYIDVKDNGLGMPAETVESLLTEEHRVSSHGSGVGLINVHKRLQLRFGEDYGLIVKSEPDMGTTVSIHMPYIEFGGDTNGK